MLARGEKKRNIFNFASQRTSCDHGAGSFLNNTHSPASLHGGNKRTSKSLLTLGQNLENIWSFLGKTNASEAESTKSSLHVYTFAHN